MDFEKKLKFLLFFFSKSRFLRQNFKTRPETPMPGSSLENVFFNSVKIITVVKRLKYFGKAADTF
jgi:hypothetical protein